MKTCNTNFEALVIEALTHELGAPPTRLVPVPTYPDTVVYEAETNAGWVVFKAIEPEGRDRDGIGLEAWACQTAAAHGVATPRVLAIDLTTRRFPTAFFVMERAEGAPLDALTLGGAQKAKLLRALGSAMRRIHAIDVEGFGWLDESEFRTGRTVRGSDEAWIDAILQDIPDAMAYLRGVGAITEDQAALANRHLEEGARQLGQYAAPRLLHGDLGLSHVWIDANRDAITSIVDWGERAAGDPVWDFIELDPTEVPLVLDGYEPEPETRDRLANMFDFYRLARAIPWAAKWNRRGESQVTDWLAKLLRSS